MPKSGYDAIASEYYDPGHVTSRNFDHTTREALREAPFAVPPEGLVLEVGAGRGRANEFLGIAGDRIVHVDNSEAMLNMEHREACLLKVFADACDLPFSKGQFSAVVGFLADPFLGLDCLAQAYKVLVDGGALLLTTPTLRWGRTLRQELGLDVMTTRFKILGTEKIVSLPSLLHSAERLREMLEHTGFTGIEILDHCLPESENPISPDIERACALENVGIHELPIIHSIRAKK